MRIWIIVPTIALLTAACGETVQQRAVTGGAGGAIAGGVLGGPIGALVGAGAGAAGGAYRDEIGREGDQFVGEQTRELALFGTPAETAPPVERERTRTADRVGAPAPATDLTNEEVRDAQVALRDMGLYDGKVDGLYGRRTIQAVGEFQEQENLPRTRALDSLTKRHLQQVAAAPTEPRREQLGREPAQQPAPDAQPPQGVQ